MYSPQFIEMYSADLHAERIAKAERQRLAYAPDYVAPTAPTAFGEKLFHCLQIMAARLRSIVSKKVQIRSSVGGSSC